MENVGNFRPSFLDPPSRGFFRPSVPPESLSLILSRVNFRGRCWTGHTDFGMFKMTFFCNEKKGGAFGALFWGFVVIWLFMTSKLPGFVGDFF